jgi:arsenite-transporting ATPase
MKPGLSPEFLQGSLLKLIFFGGKGGVGKSTCATATALTLAQEHTDQQFLLISTDPAHSVQNILDGMRLPENLEVCELNAANSLQKFKDKYDGLLKQIAERGTFLDDEDIHGMMDAALPGMDELAAYLEIATWVRQDRYEHIIVDTAPTGHTLRLLEMPDLIHRWLVALDTLLAKHRYMRRRFTRNHQLDHLDEFLLSMNGDLTAMQNLMTDTQRCRFVLVLQAESMIVEESIDLINALDQRHIPRHHIVVNQLQPAHDCEYCNHQKIRQVQALKTAVASVTDSIFWCLPMVAVEPRGRLLYDLWQHVQMVDFDSKEPTYSEKYHKPPFVVVKPLEPPAETLRVILFAGKGGVGKTTSACATALRMQYDHSGKRVLLFSTDPAHSLSDCLGMPINSIPTKVVGNLDAQEINAVANFASIRHAFSEELDAFLKLALKNLDLTFDREVMEHFLDLAPPGLDEIMALTEIMDHIDHGIYDVIILDAPPIGHFLRLLEMPELIRDWLKLFFNLLLKYRDVMRLPHLSERLVALSRGLKGLQRLLQNPEKTGAYVVTIPTELAIDKTIGMVSSLQQVGVRLQGLLINQMTPINTCDFCQSRSSLEATQIDRVRNVFSDQPQAGIYKHINPSGLNMLASLGDSLYQKNYRSVKKC